MNIVITDVIEYIFYLVANPLRSETSPAHGG